MNNFKPPILYTKYDEMIYYVDGNEVCIRKGYISKNGITKIFPLEIEDLARKYNLTRFPERKRRKAKVKNIYNYFGNIFVVAGYKYVESTNFARKSSIYISSELSKHIDISEKTLKTKISQLKRYVQTNEHTSIELIKTYITYSSVPYFEFERIINTEYRNLFEMKEEFEKLLKIYPSMYRFKDRHGNVRSYKYEFKFINSFEV